MTKYEKLVDALENSDIFCLTTESTEIPAQSMHIDKDYAIFFNEAAFETEADRFEALSHEKGHCDTGAFYKLCTPLLTKGYCERRAWRRTILDNLPFDELMEAFDACRTYEGVTICDLADYLDLSPNFINRAIEEYIRMGKQIL